MSSLGRCPKKVQILAQMGLSQLSTNRDRTNFKWASFCAKVISFLLCLVSSERTTEQMCFVPVPLNLSKNYHFGLVATLPVLDNRERNGSQFAHAILRMQAIFIPWQLLLISIHTGANSWVVFSIQVHTMLVAVSTLDLGTLHCAQASPCDVGTGTRRCCSERLVLLVTRKCSAERTKRLSSKILSSNRIWMCELMTSFNNRTGTKHTNWTQSTNFTQISPQVRDWRKLTPGGTRHRCRHQNALVTWWQCASEGSLTINEVGSQARRSTSPTSPTVDEPQRRTSDASAWKADLQLCARVPPRCACSLKIETQQGRTETGLAVFKLDAVITETHKLSMSTLHFIEKAGRPSNLRLKLRR